MLRVWILNTLIGFPVSVIKCMIKIILKGRKTYEFPLQRDQPCHLSLCPLANIVVGKAWGGNSCSHYNRQEQEKIIRSSQKWSAFKIYPLSPFLWLGPTSFPILYPRMRTDVYHTNPWDHFILKPNQCNLWD